MQIAKINPKTFYSFVIIVVIAMVIRTFFVELVVINDRVIVMQKSFFTYSRNDEVIYKNQILRIVALPGETIEIKNCKILIDDKVFVSQFQRYDCEHFTELDYKKRKVQKDRYFLMADDRNNEIDSRNYGPVKVDKIRGKVIVH